MSVTMGSSRAPCLCVPPPLDPQNKHPSRSLQPTRWPPLPAWLARCCCRWCCWRRARTPPPQAERRVVDSPLAGAAPRASPRGQKGDVLLTKSLERIEGLVLLLLRRARSRCLQGVFVRYPVVSLLSAPPFPAWEGGVSPRRRPLGRPRALAAHSSPRNLNYPVSQAQYQRGR